MLSMEVILMRPNLIPIPHYFSMLQKYVHLTHHKRNIETMMFCDQLTHLVLFSQ